VTSLLKVMNEFSIRSENNQLGDIDGRGIQSQGDKEPNVVMNQMSNGIDGKNHQTRKGGWMFERGGAGGDMVNLRGKQMIQYYRKGCW
jgi:hypothetical protein